MTDDSVANPEPRKVIARAAQCLRLLLEAGLSFDDLQTPIDDPDFRQELVDYWQARGKRYPEKVHHLWEADEKSSPEMETVSQTRAREIMGSNMLSVQHLCEFFGDQLDRHLENLAEVNFSKDVLLEHADTHVLLPDVGLSIADMINLGLVPVDHKVSQQAKDKKDSPFRERLYRARWQLVRLDPLEQSFDKTWEEQIELLPIGHCVPSTRLAVFAILFQRAVRGAGFTFEKGARTNSTFSPRGHLVISFPEDQKAVVLRNGLDGQPHPDLGLMTALE